MDEDSRGTFRNREFAKQLKSFAGLKFGNITPTDIDGFMDFGNNVFIFLESKHGVSPLPYGQKLALERLCDACCAAHKKSVVLVAHHNTSEDIDMAALPVSEYRLDGKWRRPRRDINVRQAIEKLLEWYL